MRSISCFLAKAETISAPKVKLTPLSFSPHPATSLSGSDQSRSQRRPVSGTSVGLIILLIQSRLLSSGDRPPCMHRIFSSIIAAIGRQLKQSVKVFHNLMLYLLLHSSQKPQILLIEAHSWLPLRRKKFSGYLILYANKRQTVSKLYFPLSTQSPKKR